jgi:hypothetical protein
MITATVTILDDERLIRDGEAAVAHYTKSRDEILPMARGLLAAKRKYPATQDFGTWLADSPYNQPGHTDRAALINLGEHEAITAACPSNSPDSILPSSSKMRTTNCIDKMPLGKVEVNGLRSRGASRTLVRNSGVK